MDFSELDVGSAVIGDHVEFDGLAEARAVLIDDGGEAGALAMMADGDGGVAQVAGGFVAGGVEAEGIVGTHFAGALQQEKLITKGTGSKVAQTVEVETEAVDGLHAESGMFPDVVCIFDPAGELVVELFETVDVADTLGEGEPCLGAGVVDGFEEFELVDSLAEGADRDQRALEQSPLDAGAVDLRDIVFFAVEGGQNLFDGFQQILGCDFAGGAFVGPAGMIGDAVFLIVIPPEFDGFRAEPVGLAVFIGEGHVADRLVAGQFGITFGIFEGAEHPHFQIVAYAFHVAGETTAGGRRTSHPESSGCKKERGREKWSRCHAASNISCP